MRVDTICVLLGSCPRVWLEHDSDSRSCVPFANGTLGWDAQKRSTAGVVNAVGNVATFAVADGENTAEGSGVIVVIADTGVIVVIAETGAIVDTVETGVIVDTVETGVIVDTVETGVIVVIAETGVIGSLLSGLRLQRAAAKRATGTRCILVRLFKLAGTKYSRKRLINPDSYKKKQEAEFQTPSNPMEYHAITVRH